MEKRQRGEPRSVPEAPALCCGKTCRLPHRKRRTVRPPEQNACRQRLQRLEVGASLAFILARVAAWARNIIRRWPWKLIATVGVAVAFVPTLLRVGGCPAQPRSVNLRSHEYFKRTRCA